MGGKIRDIHSIKIGKTSLMIELNEGYVPSDGRLIHIQNDKYRFLLKEGDFHHLSAMIMRAWSEFDYIKHKKVNSTPQNLFSERESISIDTNNKLHVFCKDLESKEIDFRVLDLQNRLFTIVVSESDKERFINLVKKKGAKQEAHPYSRRNGYIFLYLMSPFLLFQLDGIYIEVFCQLPCASLTPKNWIPLDRMIQKRLWQEVDLKDGIPWVEGISRYIYHLCWAVFLNNGFSPFERSYLSENKDLLKKAEMHDCLSVVFFKFTDSLIEDLMNEKFDQIIPHYYSFKEY